METKILKQLLIENLPNADITVTGDGRHFEVVIESALFIGKSKLKQHQIVNDILKNYIASGELHAISLKTFTPDQNHSLD